MKLTLCALIIFLGLNNCSAQQFNKQWMDCIVKLEREVNGQLIYHGTGFQLYNYDRQTNDFEYIVTCAHILRNRFIYISYPATDTAITFFKKRNIEFITDNKNGTWYFDGNTFRMKFELKKDTTYFVNDSLDIGIIKFKTTLDFTVFGKDTVKLTKIKDIPKSQILLKNQVDVGSDVYFLGFPFSIGTNEGYRGSNWFNDSKINPVVRGGLIGWKAEYTSQFLLDGLSYGGNSGSPIFTRFDPALKRQPSLIGMVQGHLGDDIVTSNETIPVNQGLARCIWIDDILELAKKVH